MATQDKKIWQKRSEIHANGKNIDDSQNDLIQRILPKLRTNVATSMLFLGVCISFIFQFQLCCIFVTHSLSQTTSKSNHLVKCKSPRLVVIKGERHCGTNWIRLLIDMNSKNLLVGHKTSDETDIDSAIIGWKHGLIDKYYGATVKKYNMDYEIPKLPASDVMLVVGRDAFVWLLHMQKETYDKSVQKSPNLFKFVSHQTSTSDHEPQKFRNLIHMRTVKYKEWMTQEPYPEWMVPISPNHRQAQIMDKRTYVRYEDMLVNEDAPEAILYDFFYSHCISKKPEFKKQETYTSWNRGSGKKLSSSAFEAENKQRLSESSFNYNWDTLAKYTIEEMEFVLSQLDLGFEQDILNYNYDYVTKYIEKRQKKFPGTEYNGNQRKKNTRGAKPRNEHEGGKFIETMQNHQHPRRSKAESHNIIKANVKGVRKLT